jgi:hypothetical protein
MGESLEHTKLVDSIKKWLLEYKQSSSNLCVFCDSPSRSSQDKPPAIEGFIPDIYAIIPNGELVIVGEAKTWSDIESRHSIAQFGAFLRYCSTRKNTMLVIAVPWDMVNCVKSLVRFLQKSTNTQAACVKILEKLSY